MLSAAERSLGRWDRVPAEFGMDQHSGNSSHPSGDPLERMAVHKFARKLIELSWEDAEAMQANTATEEIAGQFYESVGSIAANLAEGYSKSSGPDRARSFEYALGSARETREWYEATRPVLKPEVVEERLEILGHIQRLLVAIIPRERGRTIKPRVPPRKRPNTRLPKKRP